MKSFFLLFFLFPLLLIAQVRDTLQPGQFAISTMGNNTYIDEIDVPTVITSKYGVIKGDRVFLVADGANLDTVGTGFTPQPGDAILLQRGGEYTGTITVPASGTASAKISYGAYGTGEKPKIYGSELITGWTKRSNTDIYVTKFTKDINQLFVNGVKQQVARYPNSDYADITTANSTTQFTSTNISGSINYTGASVLIRNSAYGLKYTTVTGSTGQVVDIASATTMSIGMGVIFTNLFAFLDEAGEWYYNSTTDSLYFWADGNVDPDTFDEVRGSTKDYGIDFNSKDYVTVKNLDIRHAKEYGLYGNSGTYLTVDNCNIEYCDDMGANLIGTNLTFTNNTINGATCQGVYIESADCVVRDNTIQNTGLIADIGIKGTDHINTAGGRGLQVRGDSAVITYNRVINSGYSVLYVSESLGATVSYNFIQNACLTKDDGGGIYTNLPDNVNGTEISYNIIDNVYGSLDGRPAAATMSNSVGIYLDQRVQGVTVKNNIIRKSSQHGIHQNLGGANNVRNNIVFGALYGLGVKEEETDTAVTTVKFNNIYADNVMNNQIYSARLIKKGLTTLTHLVDSNIYVNKYSATNNFYNNETPEDSTTWRNNTGYDVHSTIRLAGLTAGYSDSLFYNATKNAITYYINSALSVKDGFTNADVTTSFTLQPFTGKVLYGNGIEYISTVQNPDVTAPVVSTFTIEETSGGVVDILSLTFTGSPAKYLITTTSDIPGHGLAWTDTIPEIYFTTTEGALTLYAWCKDAAGNISASASDNTTVTIGTWGNETIFGTLTATSTLRADSIQMPYDGYILSVVQYHGGGNGTETTNVGIYDDGSGYMPTNLLATGTPELFATGAQWQETMLTTPLFVAKGTILWITTHKSGAVVNRYVSTSSTYKRATRTVSYGTGILPNPFGTTTPGNGGTSVYVKIAN